VLEGAEGDLCLLLSLLQNDLHRVRASDEEAEDLLLAHAEEHAVALVHGQELALVVLGDELAVFFETLRVGECGLRGDLFDELPGSGLVLCAEGLDIVAFEHILEVEEVVRVLLRVILLLLLSLLFHLINFLVAGKVQMGGLVIKHDVARP